MNAPQTRRLALTALLAIATLFCPAAGQGEGSEGPKNLVLMIADGFGPASRTFARACSSEPLTLDSILVGSASTHASNNLVTDSAASATAYASGLKTYMGAVGVDPDGRPVATLVEAAEVRDMWTGVLSTTRITHATPAAFFSHVKSREEENDIADQMLGAGVEVLLGGGRRHFLPTREGGARSDDRDLMAEAQDFDYHLVQTREELFDESELPLLGLFSDSHLSYEIDREAATPDEPSLLEMTTRALELLADAPSGFLLVVEGGRIDHAGHANDAAGHLHDIRAYDAALAAALDFARERGDTLVLAVADHETGGLTLGRDVDGRASYSFDPAYLRSITSSVDGLNFRIGMGMDWREVLADFAAIASPTEREVEEIEAALQPNASRRLEATLTETINRRAGIGWTTGGHTAVDVEVFAFGPGSEAFRGHSDNAEIGRRLARLFHLDLEGLTRELR